MQLFKSTRKNRTLSSRGNRLRLSPESLEDRRVLATVTTLQDVVDPNDGAISLREAVAEAVSGEIIDFEVSGTIELDQTLGHIEIDKSLTINGDQQITIDAGLGGDGIMNGNGIRAFRVADGEYFSSLAEVTLDGLTITGGDTGDAAGSRGSAIYSLENLTISRSTITGNSNSRDENGGIVFNGIGSLTISESTIENNFSDTFISGAVYSYGQSLTVDKSTIARNESHGILAENSGSTIIRDSVISDNGGNGISNIGFAYGGSLEINRSEISNNGRGGISARTVSSTTISDSTISGNTTTGRGGGIFSVTSVELNNSLVIDNHAELGGGISVGIDGPGRPRVEVANSTVSGNTSNTSGGGIHVYYYFGSVNLSNSTVSENTALNGRGGGILAHQVFASGSTLSQNSSTQGGGAIHSQSVELTNSTVSGNTSDGNGGGIWMTHGTIESSTITANSASTGGGIFQTQDSYSNGMNFINLTDSIVAENQAASSQDWEAHEAVQLDANYNLIGQSDFPQTGTGNLVGVIAGLLPLDDNGGPTQTHALQATSPALNAGNPDPNDAPEFDQRGFIRIADGRMDIGAFEKQILIGDFNDDGVLDCHDVNRLTTELASGSSDLQFDLNNDGFVNLADLDVWLVSAGEVNLGLGSQFLPGDANLDGDVDTSDFNIWNANKFTSNSEWCSGNFNGDAFVDVGDFALWNQNKFSSGQSASLPALNDVLALATTSRESARQTAIEAVFRNWEDS